MYCSMLDFITLPVIHFLLCEISTPPHVIPSPFFERTLSHPTDVLLWHVM